MSSQYYSTAVRRLGRKSVGGLILGRNASSLVPSSRVSSSALRSTSSNIALFEKKGGLSNYSTGAAALKTPATTSYQSSFTLSSGRCFDDRSKLQFLGARTFSDKTTTTNENDDGKAADDETKENMKNEAVENEEEEKKDTKIEKPEIPREEQLEQELKNMKDQLLRSLAEQENTRRIAQRDIESARNFAIKSFAKSLLEVSDNLSRALDAVPEDMREDKDKNAVLATLYEGIKMTEVGLTKSFQSNGLAKFGEPGEVFDPNKHEALYEYPDPSKEPGSIGQVMKAGFMLNKRVLRPAEVGVVKKV